MQMQMKSPVAIRKYSSPNKTNNRYLNNEIFTKNRQDRIHKKVAD